MKIMVEKDDLVQLHVCMKNELKFISEAMNYSNMHDSLTFAIHTKISDMLLYLSKVYNPEMLLLKEKASIKYKTWLTLRDKSPELAASAFSQYLDAKSKIKKLQGSLS